MWLVQIEYNGLIRSINHDSRRFKCENKPYNIYDIVCLCAEKIVCRIFYYKQVVVLNKQHLIALFDILLIGTNTCNRLNERREWVERIKDCCATTTASRTLPPGPMMWWASGQTVYRLTQRHQLHDKGVISIKKILTLRSLITRHAILSISTWQPTFSSSTVSNFSIVFHSPPETFLCEPNQSEHCLSGDLKTDQDN